MTMRELGEGDGHGEAFAQEAAGGPTVAGSVIPQREGERRAVLVKGGDGAADFADERADGFRRAGVGDGEVAELGGGFAVLHDKFRGARGEGDDQAIAAGQGPLVGAAEGDGGGRDADAQA